MSEMKVTMRINYTDGEIVNKSLETLQQCLESNKKEINEKNECVDEINIKVD